MKLKNNIQLVLDKQGLTQKEAAKAMGIKRDYLNRIIKGNITPTVPLGIKIARALNLLVEDVFILEEK